MVIILFLTALFIIMKIVKEYYASNWDKRLSASVRFGADNINEGETGFIYEEIVNDKFLPLPIVNIKFELDKSIIYKESVRGIVSDKQYRSDVISVLPNRKIKRRFDVKYTKRGVYTIKTVDLYTPDPVSDYLRYENYDCNSVIYVYPSYSRHRDILAPFSRVMGQALKNKFIFEDPFEFKGIRNYTPLDPMKKINWGASAKTGELMVNNYFDTTSRHITIFLDVSNNSAWKRYDQLEECIRITRNLMEDFIKNQIPIEIVTNAIDYEDGNDITMESGLGIGILQANLRRLTRIDLAKEAVSMEEYFNNNESDDDELCILLSTDITDGLFSAYDRFLGNNEGEWIAPIMSPRDRKYFGGKINITYLEVDRV